MKNAVLITILIILALVGCHNTKTSDEVTIIFDAYEPSNGMLSVIKANEAGSTTVSKDVYLLLNAAVGNTISNTLIENGILSIQANSTNDIFEGWIIYRENTIVDEKIYTTDEILKMTVPNYGITFVAKWKNISTKNYYN